MSVPGTVDVAPLATLIEALSVDAINLQLLFDQEHEGDLLRFGRALAAR